MHKKESCRLERLAQYRVGRRQSQNVRSSFGKEPEEDLLESLSHLRWETSSFMLNALPLRQSDESHGKGPRELFEFESYRLARFERPASPKKAVCNPNRTREKQK